MNFLATDPNRMWFSISKWHCTPSVTKLKCLKWFNRLFTIWHVASCHPCDILVFYNRLVPNAITVYSHYSLGGKESQQHEQLNPSFGDLFPQLL